MNDVRHGKCEFADFHGEKRLVTWVVRLDLDGKTGPKKRIKKTDVWMLKIMLDNELCVLFEDGRWKRRPPLFGAARDAYRLVMSVYSKRI